MAALWGQHGRGQDRPGRNPPLALAGIRFLSARDVLVWALAGSCSSAWSRQAHRNGAAGRLFLVQIAFLNLGVKFTLASRAALFLATYPFWTALLAHFFVPGDRLSGRTVTGLLLAFSGLIFFRRRAACASRIARRRSLCPRQRSLLGVRVVYTKRLTANMHPGSCWCGSRPQRAGVLRAQPVDRAARGAVDQPPVAAAIAYQASWLPGCASSSRRR